MLTRELVPGSLGLFCEGHQELLSAASNNGHRLPRLLEAATGVLTHYVRTSDRLLGDDVGGDISWPFTRCHELVSDKPSCPLVVGGFVAAGLNVSTHLNGNARVGVVGCWKF